MSGVVVRLAGRFAPLGALELVVEPVKGWRIVPMAGKRGFPITACHIRLI